jgi:predicted ATP-grasp superfamily ATP-dependent carboligase
MEGPTVRPVVVVGAYTPGLAVIRALGSQGVPVVVARYDKRDMGQASKWAHEVQTCPHPEFDESRFVDYLVELAKRHPDAMLVPASDQALGTVATHAELLGARGYRVAAPAERAVFACLNKSETYALAERSGVPSPFTRELVAEVDVARYAAAAGFPAVLKPTLSHRYYAVFGRKWTRVDRPEHAIWEYRRARAAGLEVMLQELIPGDEQCGANYNAYFWNGEPLAEMTATKVRNSPAETGSPSVVVSQELPELLAPARQMLRALAYQGFANIEFKRDPRDNLYKIIEVNARHNLSAALAYHCGINFPWLQYRHLMYGERPRCSEYRQGLYWIDVTRDLKEAPTYLRRPEYSLRQFLRPYLAPHVSAVWDASALGPARLRAWDTLRSLAAVIRGGSSSARVLPAPTRAVQPPGTATR